MCEVESRPGIKQLPGVVSRLYNPALAGFFYSNICADLTIKKSFLKFGMFKFSSFRFGIHISAVRSSAVVISSCT